MSECPLLNLISARAQILHTTDCLYDEDFQISEDVDVDGLLEMLRLSHYWQIERIHRKVQKQIVDTDRITPDTVEKSE